jgi:hypothetical protein
MDLALYGRVLRRFWWLVLPGLALACALAFLSLARVSPNGSIAYRHPVVWQSTTLLLLTQPGFPWGRTVYPTVGPGTSGDPGRLTGLTDLYSQFANGDEVRQLMRREGAPASWSVVAAPVVPTLTGSTLPIVALSGRAHSPSEAVSAVTAGRQALSKYVELQQRAAKIPGNQRISLQVVKRATTPIVVEPRKKTLAIVVFLAVMVATVGLAFVLENLRPRAQAVAPAASARPARRRTA